METLFPTLSVTFNQRRWVCVLDPTLILGAQGLQGLFVTQQLSQWLELWVVRELWHILDNTHFYVSGPRRLDLSPPNAVSDTIDASSEFNPRAVDAWEQLRLQTDLAGLRVYWLGDGVSQSCLPTWIKEGVNPQALINRYELLARSLEDRLSAAERYQPWIAAYRDAVAIAVTLGSAWILTIQPQPNTAPNLVNHLQRWGISCQQQPIDDPIVAIERSYLHHLFVHAGLSPLLWSTALSLAVLHLVIPAAFSPELLRSGCPPEVAAESAPLEGWDLDPPAPADPHLWSSAQGFWYPLHVTPIDYEHSSHSLHRASTPV